MTTSYHISAIFALETPRATFWVDTGEKVSKCPEDIEHPVHQGARYCSMCGRKPIEVPVETPTSAFAKFCEDNGVTPETGFDRLSNPSTTERWDWVEGNVTMRIVWLPLSPILAAENTNTTYGLGFELGTKSAQDKTPFAINVEILRYVLTPGLAELAQLFGITSQPRLYIQGQISY